MVMEMETQTLPWGGLHPEEAPGDLNSRPTSAMDTLCNLGQIMVSLGFCIKEAAL